MSSDSLALLPSHLGVHITDRPSGSEQEHQQGGLGRWYALTLAEPGLGHLLVHTKVYDESGLWRSGKSPDLTTGQKNALEDCDALGATPLFAYCPFTRLHPGSPLEVQGWRSALTEAMKAFMRKLPRGSAVIFCNERELSWTGDELIFFDLEAEFGLIAKAYGMLWIVGGDLVEANTIESIRSRMAAWERYGVEPAAIAIHSYGQGGTLFRHVKDIAEALARVAGRTFKLIWTEWGWGFPGEGKTRADREDLNTSETGAWLGGFALALAAQGAGGCFFSLNLLFHEDGSWTAAAEEFEATLLSGEAKDPRPPPPHKAREKTLRYLSAGRSWLSALLYRLLA